MWYTMAILMAILPRWIQRTERESSQCSWQCAGQKGQIQTDFLTWRNWIRVAQASSSEKNVHVSSLPSDGFIGLMIPSVGEHSVRTTSARHDVTIVWDRQRMLAVVGSLWVFGDGWMGRCWQMREEKLKVMRLSDSLAYCDCFFWIFFDPIWWKSSIAAPLNGHTFPNHNELQEWSTQLRDQGASLQNPLL